jgi:hypothetical protein
MRKYSRNNLNTGTAVYGRKNETVESLPAVKAI